MYRRYTANAAAYELYLKGRSAIQRDPYAALTLFDEALRMDGSNALARAGKAEACALIRVNRSPTAEVPKWEQCAAGEARAALKIDPDLAEAHQAMASVHRWSDFDWENTIRESDRALELNPSLHLPHQLRADAFRHLGLLDLAEREIHLAVQNNPGAPGAPAFSTTLALMDGRFSDGVRLLSSSGRKPRGYYDASLLFHTGDREAAIRVLDEGPEASVSGRGRDAARASLLAAVGKKEEAAALLEALSSMDYRDHHTAYSVGAAFAQLGKPAEAVTWLRRAAEWGFVCYPWYANDPLLKPLANDAEFQRLAEELRRAWIANKRRFGSQTTVRE
jgi:tetratricopeptide (TPR) repeat protein